jgi:hypothetical protein
MSSIRRGQLAQNVYSAQRCVKGSDCQTTPNLKGTFCTNGFPMEQSPIRAPIDAHENTTVSYGDVKRVAKFCVSNPTFVDCGTTPLWILINIRDDPVKNRAISLAIKALKEETPMGACS